MRNRWTMTGLVTAALVLTSVLPTGATGDVQRTYPALDSLHGHHAPPEGPTTAHGSGSGSGHNLSLVGHLGPEDDERMAFPNSDVWSYGDHAYVGTWSLGPDLCPATGVKVIDISDPTDPRVATTIPSPDASLANDVKVERISTPDFRGVLLAHSNEPCAEGGSFGFELYDVSDPANPVHVSGVGAEASGPVHNLYLFQRGSQAFLLLAVPFGEVFGVFGPEPAADLLLYEVTDPSNPVLRSTWTVGRDAGLAFGSPFFAGDPALPPGSDCTPPPGTPQLCRGDDFPGVLLHDVWANPNGTVAYLSYWDAGLILLDISDPSSPVMLGRGQEVPALGSDEGNLHAAVPARGGNLVVTADEDFSPVFADPPSFPWGFLRIFDTSDPANPIEIGQFATENSLTAFPPAPFTDYSAHNVEVRGSTAYVSWYGDGIRLIDISQPTKPREVASYTVPSPTSFWGVHVQGDLILGSDIVNGLFILERTPDR